MVQFEELLLKLQALKPEIDDLSDALGMKGMLSEIQQLELKATEPGFWDDVEKSQKVLQRTGSLKGKVEAYEGLVAKYEDTHALIELANEEEDESLLEEAENEVEAVKENLEKQGYKVNLYLKGLGENPTVQQLFIQHARFAAGHKAVDMATRKKGYMQGK